MRRLHYTNPVPATFANLFEAMRFGCGEFTPRPCFSPTDAVPGSEEKLAVLSQRVEAGVDLWHQLDRQDCENLT